MRDKLINLLENVVNERRVKCENVWKGNTDGSLGACYYYEVRPVRELIEYVKETIPEEEAKPIPAEDSPECGA